MNYLIFDCNAIAWRSFYSIGRLPSNNGVDSGVVYGFLNQLLQFSQEFQINKILFCFDSRLRKRSKILKTYKQRDHSKDSEEDKEAKLAALEQIKDLRTMILPAIGFKNIYFQTGYEADDLIAKLTLLKPNECVIVTNDEDLFQLCGKCTWYSPWRKMTINKIIFKRKYGIEPEQWGDVKKIAGCKSDMVPGVKGIGEARAISYLKGELSPALTKKIKGEWKTLQRNDLLVKLPFPGTKDVEIVKDEFDIESFKQICELYGFNSHLKKLDIWNQQFKQW